MGWCRERGQFGWTGAAVREGVGIVDQGGDTRCGCIVWCGGVRFGCSGRAGRFCFSSSGVMSSFLSCVTDESRAHIFFPASSLLLSSQTPRRGVAARLDQRTVRVVATVTSRDDVVWRGRASHRGGRRWAASARGGPSPPLQCVCPGAVPPANGHARSGSDGGCPAAQAPSPPPAAPAATQRTKRTRPTQARALAPVAWGTAPSAAVPPVQHPPPAGRRRHGVPRTSRFRARPPRRVWLWLGGRGTST